MQSTESFSKSDQTTPAAPSAANLKGEADVETEACELSANETNDAPNSGDSSGSNGSSEFQTKITALEKETAQLKEQLKDRESKSLYAQAEFENFKKRTARERADLLKFGWESAALDLLAVLDNLERALAHSKPETDKNLIDGLKMILDQFKSTLQKQGITAVEGEGKDFDPHVHEAVAEEESESKSGIILRELARGYTLHGRLLRPAKVIVSKGK